jgi:hypothetical protein
MELHFRTPLKTVSLIRVSTIEFPQRVLAFLSPVLHVLRNSHPFPQICRYNQNIGLPLVAVSSLVLGNETGQTLLVWRMKMPGPHPHFGKKLHHLPEYMVPHVLYCIPPWSVNSGVGILKP